jgi:Uma2 family endonuclease
MGEAKRARMTITEFLRWQEFQEDHYELVDGEPQLHRLMSGASQRHDHITMNALLLLGNQLRGHRCQPITADVAIQVPGRGLRRADAAVDCGPLRDAEYVASEPILVVEVLSPSTRQIDRFRKLEEYKTVASLRYILLIEPSQPTAKLYQRDGESWTSIDPIGLDATIEVVDLDLTLPLRDLYEGLSFENGEPERVGAENP